MHYRVIAVYRARRFSKATRTEGIITRRLYRSQSTDTRPAQRRRVAAAKEAGTLPGNPGAGLHSATVSRRDQPRGAWAREEICFGIAPTIPGSKRFREPHAAGSPVLHTV